jgi:hypothetical protein
VFENLARALVQRRLDPQHQRGWATQVLLALEHWKIAWGAAGEAADAALKKRSPTKQPALASSVEKLEVDP